MPAGIGEWTAGSGGSGLGIRDSGLGARGSGLGNQQRRLTIRSSPDTLNDVRPKLTGLDPSYAAQFDDSAIVAAYHVRPPYADGVVSLIVDLAGGANGRILDLGCGTGELTRRVSADVQSITAIDRSARMVAEARRLRGGNRRNVEWIVGRAEDFPPSGRFTLVLAAESFHWFDWDIVCPRLVELVDACPAVLVDRWEIASPWESQLQSLIARFSTNRDFQRYD